jgi:CBS domain-containing membrane protein
MSTSSTDTPGRFALFMHPAWWRAFWPAPIAVNASERWRGVCGAVVGILFTAVACHFWVGPAMASLPWIIAPMGASAVLVFAVPASPLAQPWAVVGGNTLSALVGIAMVRWGGVGDWTAALAVGSAIGMMFMLRCLHPPGGATALMMVLGGIADPAFALFPVLLNSVLLTLAGIAYNNATRRRYPHAQVLPPPSTAARATQDDLDAVLARYNQVLDISRDDLQAFIEQTQAQGYQRRMADIRCGDIMSRKLVTVAFGTPLQEAWTLLRQRRIKALPVVDRTFRIVGIVTLADFMRSADLDHHHDDVRARLHKLLRKTPTTHSDKPEVVGQIMTRQVRVASEHRSLVELVPLFGSTGHHHIPIIGERERLVGILTQSDVVAALCRPTGPA